METKEDLRMGVKAADRLGVMRQMDKRVISARQASEQLGISVKQVRRIRKRYLQEGERGIISRKVGKPSANKTPQEIRDKVMNLLRTDYCRFGPTFAAEKLAEMHQLKLSSEMLRKWMIEDGLWRGKKRKEKRVYQRRARRNRFGELIQGDGSHHDWFEGRSEKCCLLVFIDDATSEITSALFLPTETTEGYLECLKGHLIKYGKPLALYVDKHSVFRVNREELKKGTGITHFGKVLKELGIELICANSPQAKGRVERNNGILQDRLVKEMRLAKINTIEEGNAFLPGFLKKYNERFRKEAAYPEDAHRPITGKEKLGRIFARQDKRKLSKELTFQFKGTLYMIQTDTPNQLRYKEVDVFWTANDPIEVIEVEHKGTKLQYKTSEEVVYEQPAVVDAKALNQAWATKKPKIPTKQSKHHPWRR